MDMDYDFSILPPHILTAILLYTQKNDFKNAVLVCQSWYYASFDPKITRTRRTIMTTGPTSIGVDQLARPITHLFLDHPNFNMLKYRQLFTKFGRTINHLQINCNKLQIPKLYEMLIHLPRLESLEIFDRSNEFSAQNFYNSSKLRKHLEIIKQNLKNVKFLAIRTSLTNLEGYKLLLTYCRNIKRLEWNKYGGVDASGQRNFVNNFLLNTNEVPGLLNLNELLIHSVDEWHSSEFFAKIVGLNLPHLKNLDIQKISLDFSDVNFIQFCKVYRNLEYLHLSNVFAEHLYLIGRDMTNLKCLNLMCSEDPQLSLLRNLKFLETLIIDRYEADHLDDETLFNALKWENLKKLELNKITANVLILICESLKNLVILKLMEVETKDCEPIYRNLTQLEILHLGFEEPTECHSSNIINSDEWNITCLVRLKEIYVSCYVSGITPNLLKTLPNLNEDCLKIISRDPYFEY